MAPDIFALYWLEQTIYEMPTAQDPYPAVLRNGQDTQGWEVSRLRMLVRGGR
jgi:hypothetical protein